MSDENKKHEGEKKHHEKRIVGRVNHNNINLSHHAKHDWKPAHEAHHKAAAKAKEAAPNDNITVQVDFQTLDRVGEEGDLVPANDPELEPLTPVLLETFNVTVPGDYSAKDLLDYMQQIEVTYTQADTTLPTDYVDRIAKKDESWGYATDGGYDPDPPEDEDIVVWSGKSWMFFNGPSGVPEWNPQDNLPWDPGIVPPDGIDGYPNGTVDMYAPLVTLLDPPVDGKYRITFSYETQCFSFLYEEQEVNGVKHMVLVIRPMRRKKPKK